MNQRRTTDQRLMLRLMLLVTTKLFPSTTLDYNYNFITMTITLHHCIRTVSDIRYKENLSCPADDPEEQAAKNRALPATSPPRCRVIRDRRIGVTLAICERNFSAHRHDPKGGPQSSAEAIEWRDRREESLYFRCAGDIKGPPAALGICRYAQRAASRWRVSRSCFRAINAKEPYREEARPIYRMFRSSMETGRWNRR